MSDKHCNMHCILQRQISDKIESDHQALTLQLICQIVDEIFESSLWL
jgi:hypothetical protein